jgi:hypothetical protein
MDGPSLGGPCSGALQGREGYMLLLGASLSLILTVQSRLQRTMGKFTKAFAASS